MNFLENGWNDRFVQNYINFITNITSILGLEIEKLKIEEIQDILIFEVNLTQICIPREKRRNPKDLFYTMTVKDMQNKYPYFNWLRFIQESYPHLDINENEVIALNDKNFFEKFGILLKSTPKRTIANYIIWRVVVQAIPYLSERFRDSERLYTSLFYGHLKRQPRWKDCVLILLSEMPIVLGSMYARRYFNEQAKKEAVNMIEMIKNEFENVLISANWMDPTTKKAAILKLHNMSAFVGYPDELKSDRKLEEYYVNFQEFKKGDFLESILKNNRFLIEKWSSMLREPVSKSDWRLLSKVVDINAYYDAAENKMRKLQNYFSFLMKIYF